MAESYKKLKDNDMPLRAYPPFSIEKGIRTVTYPKLIVEVPSGVGYMQYLMQFFLQILFRKNKNELYSLDQSSVVGRLYENYIKKFTSGPANEPVALSEDEVYLQSFASDLELLLIKDRLPESLIKRVNSNSDNEMRSAIYEINIAAAFIRSGFEINWLEGHKLPELTAEKSTKRYDVEAKRRQGAKDKSDFKSDIRAIKKRVRGALTKNISNPYLIFVDTDLPPASSADYTNIFKEIQDSCIDILNGATLMVTNSGYEHVEGVVNSGRNSGFYIAGNGAPTAKDMQTIITSMHAKFPPSFSLIWRHE